VDFEEEEQPEAFDPRKLQPVEYIQPVGRGEQAFSIIVSVVVLTWLAIFVSRSGFSGVDGPNFFTNPVIEQYLALIGISMITSIVVDIVLLWKGRWTLGTRLAKIGADLFALVVLGLLLQGSSAWLAEAGVVGYLDWLPHLAELPVDSQLAGMSIFRIVFAVAFIITFIEIIVQVFRIIQGRVRSQRAEVVSYGNL
ncbi:MAG: hypothetical protein R3335_13500, partial [Anaerolineales bacterium]|nr:hypothetical protein [Anaerolineales bacterium]